MISELAADLLAKIAAVPTLELSTSFAIGGKAADPALKDIPLPACRLILMAIDPDEDPRTTRSGTGGGTVPLKQMMLFTMSAVVIVPYGDDDDILNVQFPLLESVIEAVKGVSPSGHRWRFFGQKPAFIYPDRLGFEQRYTLDAVL